MAEFLRGSDVKSIWYYYDVVVVVSYIAWRSAFRHKVNRARQMMQAEEFHPTRTTQNTPAYREVSEA